jgi:hypothetical protein
MFPIRQFAGRLAIIIPMLLLSPSLTSAASASTENEIVVTSLSNDFVKNGNCTLVEAVVAARDNIAEDACPAGISGLDIITFRVHGTIFLTEPLSIYTGGPLVIDGGGAITISGNHTVTVIGVSYPVDFTLQNLTVADGWSANGRGGGLHISSSTVTIYNTTFTGNSSYMEGGGIFNDSGSLIIVNSTFSGNDGMDGGAIFNYYGKNMEISNSVFVGNHTNKASRIGGAIVSFYSTLTITNSTFSGNQATKGAGLYDSGDLATISNTTFTNNIADLGRDLYAYNYFGSVNTMTIVNSTFADSSSSSGGAIYNENSLTLYNTIVANAQSGENCAGPVAITDGGHNIDNGSSCGFSPANGSMNNTDPLLGSLGNYGGSTPTMPILPGSPARDNADPLHCLATDQRGASRKGTCDIGAYELYGTITALSSSPNPSIFGKPITLTATVVEGDSGTPTGKVTFTSGTLTLGSADLNPSAIATLVIDTLPVGNHLITASYDGDSIFAASISSAVKQTVNLQVFLPAVVRKN